jgi:pimeloyl-ACP methyl ester carboxylesterase
MNVSVEFNQIASDSARRTRISVLREVELGAALSISAALRHDPEVEAVIVVDGAAARPRSGWPGGLPGKPLLSGWLNCQQARPAPRLAPDWVA